MRLFFAFIIAALLVSCSHSYYIVRHAEKETAGPNMSSEVPLSDKGKERAEALKGILKNKKIGYVFSTNTIRTKSTAQPLADYLGLQIEIYKPVPDSAFIRQLRSLKKNVLIVGHSNTVDDIVNMLCGGKEVAGDLGDNEYNKLFIVKFRGKRTFFWESMIYPSIPFNPRF
jgi:broad specificity phosphatase PhoE